MKMTPETSITFHRCLIYSSIASPMLKRELNCWKKKERNYYLSDLVPGSERTEQALQKISQRTSSSMRAAADVAALQVK